LQQGQVFCQFGCLPDKPGQVGREVTGVLASAAGDLQNLPAVGKDLPEQVEDIAFVILAGL
jgi:hypothetical protein